MARTRRYRKRRRPAFTKRQAKAVVALAQRPIETKVFINNLSFGEYHYTTPALGPYSVPTHQGGFYYNPIGSLPTDVRLVSSVDPSQPNSAVVGDEIILRGLKIEGYALVTGTRNYTLRLSLISGPPYGNQSTWPVFPLNNPSPYRIQSGDNIYAENTIYGDATQIPFNRNKFTVLRTKTYKLGYMDGTDTRKFKMYYRMNQRKVSEAQPDDADSQRKRLGWVKGKNYYWVFEWFNAAQNVAFSATDNLSVRMQCNTYWKDA
uniref:Capsid protein n=1 Tax=Phoenicopteridae CRESS-DNA-virus sp. TaxID=2815051 RepID=A0A8A4XCZ1_9VIRU|nr:MAG: hypothetical protein [Phoenicopteridae CRESS-DNA-virus sp.]